MSEGATEPYPVTRWAAMRALKVCVAQELGVGGFEKLWPWPYKRSLRATWKKRSGTSEA